MTNKKCLTPDCNRPSAPLVKTGLCLICHSNAKKMVAAGLTTWEQIIALGLALPEQGVNDLFAQELQRRKNASNQQTDTTS